jgi:hypothetical protein
VIQDDCLEASGPTDPQSLADHPRHKIIGRQLASEGEYDAYSVVHRARAANNRGKDGSDGRLDAAWQFDRCPRPHETEEADLW